MAEELHPLITAFTASITVEAGETKELFSYQPAEILVNGEKVPLCGVLSEFDTNRDADLILHPTLNASPLRPINTNGLRGLRGVRPPRWIVHYGETLTFECENKAASDKTLTYRFVFLEYAETGEDFIQRYIIENASIAANSSRSLFSARVPRGRAFVVHSLQLAQVSDVKLFVKIDDRNVFPDGLLAAAFAGIERPETVIDVVVPELRKLDIYVTNYGGAATTLPVRIWINDVPAETAAALARARTTPPQR